MAVISKGQTFATGDQVTALKLNNLADNATFASGAVDNVSTQLSGGAIVVKDGGVTTAKLNDGAVTTAKIADANVTFAKLTDVIDDDTMATASATKLATSESIKAYVDTSKTSAFTPSTYAGEESVTLPNGLIMKFGQVAPASRSQHEGEYLLSFASSFPNAIITATTSILATSGYPDNHAFVDDLAVSGMRLVSGSTAIGTTTYGWTWTAIGY